MPNPKISPAELAKVQKRSKYGVRHDAQGKLSRTYNGVLYHSKREAEYAQELDVLKMAGKIASWERQRAYSLEVNGQHICNYVADFVVTDNRDLAPKCCRERVIDVKGHMTQAARLKLNLMRAIHGIEVEIVR